MNLSEIRNRYVAEGLDYLNASARTCQDALLQMLGNCAMGRRVTLKGGVVIQHLSGDSRRATLDIDLDFIRYSLEDRQIEAFIERLNEASPHFRLVIEGDIEPLRHQDYQGKRVHIYVHDHQGTSIQTKLDLGVHKNLDIELEEYCFDLAKLEDTVTLLINTREQIVAEKLKSLLRLGAFSTRYKDIFDMCFLVSSAQFDGERLDALLALSTYADASMREKNRADIHRRLEQVFSNRRYMTQLSRSKKDWIAVSADEAAQVLLKFFSEE